ncbi:MAG: biotin--[acetyl-CoA-carboxylase] ligase [Parachlamydiaceae bacterium]|nr:biotin--[acetyl-CoA-carboxylase] ligase [Parachlamydiaceae bacterium]
MTGHLSKIKLKHFATLDSTNTKAAEYIHRLEADTLLMITADEQTSGRGRFSHSWLSPPGQNLYATFGFFIDKNRLDVGNIPQIMALSAAEVLQKHGLSSCLKWPNDLLIDKKKIGGVLAETFAVKKDDDGRLYMTIGIGININMPVALLETLGRPATSVLIETGNIGNLKTIQKDLLQCFLKDLNLFFDKGFHPFLQNYQKQMVLQKDDKMSFHVNGKILEGKFHEITPQGSLKLRLPDGNISEFVSGEVFLKKN